MNEMKPIFRTQNEKLVRDWSNEKKSDLLNEVELLC